MRLFFAGTEPKKYRDILLEEGAKNGLESFWTLNQKKEPNQNSWPGLYLLDSGGYSARMRGVKIDVKKYAAYLNRHKIKFAFNLDPPDNHESLQNLYYLQENTNTYIIPIFHGPEYLDPEWRPVLDYYVENYPFISLGGIAGREVSAEVTTKFLNYVFKRTRDKVAVHGLGNTRKSLLYKYPFYSADSTSWQAGMRFAGSDSYSLKGHSLIMTKIKSKSAKSSPKRYELIIAEAAWWLKLESDTTRLWLHKGIDWSNVEYEYCMKNRTMKRWEDEPPQNKA